MRSERQPASHPFTGESEAPGDLRQWAPAASKQKVVLPAAIVEELSQAAIAAFLAIPRRGVEIGGLLLGEMRQEGPASRGGQTAVFQVAEVEDVPCEHSFGPSYLLSEADQRLFTERLERRRREGLPPVIGFYRSYTGREAELDGADESLLGSFFPQGDLVCLLLQPTSVEKCTACFRFRRNGKTLPEPACNPFPFEASQLEPFVATPQAEPVANGTEEARHPAFAPPSPWHHRYREEETMPPGGGWPGILPKVLMGILFAIAFAAVYQLWALRREPRWEPLRFDARMYDGALVLSWDPAAPAVAQAERGVLLVNDGRDPRTIQLSPEQLRRGNLPYTPGSADLRFRLRLYDDGSSVVTDTLRVISLPGTPAAGGSAPAAAPSPAVPPAVSSVAPPTAAAPIVRREVQPEIPPGIRRRITSPQIVVVAVEIDASGRVTRASAQDGGAGLNRYLTEQAVNAARQWVFTPARANDGAPMAARRTLSFEFTPPGH